MKMSPDEVVTQLTNFLTNFLTQYDLKKLVLKSFTITAKL